MTEKKEFLNFETFWNTVGEKRSHSIALEDMNMLMFDSIMYDSEADEYSVDVWLKDKYRDKYFTNHYLKEHGLVFLDTIHLVHWANWLNIGVIVKRHPELSKSFFFSTRLEMVLDEPTFTNQPITYAMKILTDRSKTNKHEFTFINRIGNWGYIIDDYVVVENQFPILEHYHKKHKDLDVIEG